MTDSLLPGQRLRGRGVDSNRTGRFEPTSREAYDDGWDLVLTDLALGKGTSGMDVLAKARRCQSHVPVVIITAHGNERIAVPYRFGTGEH